MEGDLCNILKKNEMWTVEVIRALNTRNISTLEEFENKGEEVLDEIEKQDHSYRDTATSRAELEHLRHKYATIPKMKTVMLENVLEEYKRNKLEKEKAWLETRPSFARARGVGAGIKEQSPTHMSYRVRHGSTLNADQTRLCALLGRLRVGAQPYANMSAPVTVDSGKRVDIVIIGEDACSSIRFPRRDRDVEEFLRHYCAERGVSISRCRVTLNGHAYELRTHLKVRDLPNAVGMRWPQIVIHQ